jgi:RNA polymerase sigma-70 factor (ECF subfamily)
MNECAGSAITRSTNQSQESSWVSASQKGDTLAFNRLVLKWERTVYNAALRMLQNREEAAEAAQEIFLLAFKSIRRFRHDSQFSTWLYRITLNHCITRLKQRPAGAHFSIDDPTAPGLPSDQLRVAETQAGDLIRSEQKIRVLRAISHLPPDQRAVIELKFFQELTFEDIAEVLGTPLSTIKSRLYAALEILKVRLSSEV